MDSYFGNQEGKKSKSFKLQFYHPEVIQSMNLP